MVYSDYKYIYSDVTNTMNELQLYTKIQTDPDQKKSDNDILSHTQDTYAPRVTIFFHLYKGLNQVTFKAEIHI